MSIRLLLYLPIYNNYNQGLYLKKNRFMLFTINYNVTQFLSLSLYRIKTLFNFGVYRYLKVKLILCELSS